MKPKERVISLRVDEGMASYIEAYAKRYKVSISQAVRLILQVFYSPMRYKKEGGKILKQLNTRITEAEEVESLEEAHKKIAQGVEAELQPLWRLVEESRITTDYLYESYLSASNLMHESLRDYLDKIKETQQEQAVEPYREKVEA
ncbi:MAG: hypothetical protein PHP63_08730 [Candidatus Marinimicrobia bacterium]|nr:hypothetical protein [Candidatus Neomarinimicrobiota bacterium]